MSASSLYLLPFVLHPPGLYSSGHAMCVFVISFWQGLGATVARYLALQGAKVIVSARGTDKLQVTLLRSCMLRLHACAIALLCLQLTTSQCRHMAAKPYILWVFPVAFLQSAQTPMLAQCDRALDYVMTDCCRGPAPTALGPQRCWCCPLI